jgi:hypothetical protein
VCIQTKCYVCVNVQEIPDSVYQLSKINDMSVCVRKDNMKNDDDNKRKNKTNIRCACTTLIKINSFNFGYFLHSVGALTLSN